MFGIRAVRKMKPLDRTSLASASLLTYVRQFMHQQPLSGRRAGLELTLAENDVPPNRIRQRIQRASGFRGARIRMHSHVAQVCAETRLHERSRRIVKRFT